MDLKPIIDSDFGINVTIHIACCGEDEILMHLSVLRQQIKKSIKRKNKDSQCKTLFNDKPGLQTQTFEDNNCYGTHDAIIVQDV